MSRKAKIAYLQGVGLISVAIGFAISTILIIIAVISSSKFILVTPTYIVFWLLIAATALASGFLGIRKLRKNPSAL